MQNSERINVSHLRERYGLRAHNFTSTDRRLIAADALVVQKSSFGKVLEKQELLIDVLGNSRDDLIDELYIEPTPAGIAARYLVERWGDIMLTLALNDLAANDIENFTLYYDIAYGIKTVGFRIGLADRLRAVSIGQVLRLMPDDTYLNQGLRIDAEALKPVLEADEGKGFFLADYVAETFKGNIPTSVSYLKQPHVQEFVTAGAEAGAHIYKQIHPLIAEMTAK